MTLPHLPIFLGILSTRCPYTPSLCCEGGISGTGTITTTPIIGVICTAPSACQASTECRWSLRLPSERVSSPYLKTSLPFFPILLNLLLPAQIASLSSPSSTPTVSFLSAESNRTHGVPNQRAARSLSFSCQVSLFLSLAFRNLQASQLRIG